MEGHIMDLRCRLIILFFLTLFSIVSCDQPESDVKVELIPEGPVVIDADYEFISALTGEKETVTKPWFSFKMKIKNSSKKTITVTALLLEVLGVSKSGPTTATVDFTGEGDSNGLPVLDTDCDGSVSNLTDKVGVLFEVAPGVGCISRVTWYAGSLPEDSDFQYTVRGKFIGWYNKVENGEFVPEERLEVNTTISTR